MATTLARGELGPAPPAALPAAVRCSPCAPGSPWIRRALGFLLLFLVARPLVGRLNLGR
jgi:hypothetical protein